MKDDMIRVSDRLQTFYESFRTEREGAIARLEEFFTDDVHFRDPFRNTVGIEPLRALFVRMFKQYRVVDFTDFRCKGNEQAFTLTYDMSLKMVIGPTFVTPVASVCVTRGDKICDLADYFDFSSGLLSPIPIAASLYQKAVNALFL